MQEINSEKPLVGADNNSLIALISINLVVYALIGFFKVVYYLSSAPLDQFYTQVFNPTILFPNLQIVLHQPWTLLTYNWSHDGFWILLNNMIWLTAFGLVLQSSNANKHLFPIYFYSGLMAGIVFCFLGAGVPLMGASISVMAIVIAAVVQAPKYKLLENLAGGIPLWVLGLIYLIIQFSSIMHEVGPILIVHFVGAATGLFYILLLRKGMDLGKWMHQLLHILNNSLAPKK